MVGLEPGYGPPPIAKRGMSTRAIVIAIVGGSLAMALIIFAAFVGYVLYNNKSIRYDVPGVGMEPTIHAGERVTATKVDPGEYRPSRGDIVVFTSPAGWLANGDQKQIKRVIGLPGERLVCCNQRGQWMINGMPLVEPYIKPGDQPMSFDIVVPEGRLWIMGDNRAASSDSRQHFATSDGDIDFATIPVSAVTAIVKLED